jgi:uncharacterized protein
MANSLKILAVSDRVMENLYTPNIRDYHSDVDLIIGCGDLPFYYLDFLISALDVPLVYVRGNHDEGPQYAVDKRVLTHVPGGQEIHGRSVHVKGILLAGLEGSMRYRPRASLMYTEAEMRREIVRLLPHLFWNRQRYGRFLDILITHSPPLGIHDRSDLPHTGFRVFLTLLKLFKPSMMLHGHIHLYRQDALRVSQFMQTTILNVYPYRILDFDPLP